MFQPLLTRLGDNYHLVALDYPGFGHSDWPDPKQFGYTSDRIASVMDGFTESLGLSHYTLYMQDYGGPVGFRMALARPERVQALIIQDAVARKEGLGANWATRRAFSPTGLLMKRRCATICYRLQPRRRAIPETTRRLSCMIRIFGPMSTHF